MARSIIFKVKGAEYSFNIVKLDRSKLYGSKEIIAFDDNDQVCLRIDVDETGSFMIPPGGTALGMLADDGTWVDRQELKVVCKDSGKPAELVPSSFSEPVDLKETVTVEEFLDHSIQYVYALDSSEAGQVIDEIKNLKDIYTFQFNYRTDYEASPAFVIENNGKLFILVGYNSAFDYISLEQAEAANVEEDFSLEDDLDFSMM